MKPPMGIRMMPVCPLESVVVDVTGTVAFVGYLCQPSVNRELRIPELTTKVINKELFPTLSVTMMAPGGTDIGSFDKAVVVSGTCA